MILLTRLNGTRFALNADLIEKVEAKPDTVVTLIDSSIYIVSDSLEDVIDSVIDFRAGIVARSARSGTVVDPTPLRVVAPEVHGATESDDAETSSEEVD